MSYLEKIPEKWKLTTIEEETIVVTDYVANGSFASLKENVTYSREISYARLIRLTDHNNHYEGEGVYVDKHSFDFLKKSKLEPNDIIISNVGEYSGTLFKVPNLKMPMTLGPNSILVKFKDSQDFMYYFLQSKIGQHLINTVKSGSANPKFNKTEFKKIEFIIPQPEEQKAIANILTAFDNKIELLQQQNSTLETLAQTIFNEWFGKYQVDDELPEGWRVETIDNIVELIIDYRGKTPKKLGMDWSENGIPALSAKTIKNGKIVRRDAMNFGSEELYSIWMKDKLQKGDILLTSEAPLGEMYYLTSESKYILSQRLFSLRVNTKLTSQYLYHYLFSPYGQHLLNARASGSTVEGIRQSELRRIKVIIPEEQILNKASEIFKSVFEKAAINDEQIQSLTKTRDTLLPKLMSGQVRVKM